MKKILMTICLIGGLAMLWSCSDDKDSYPVPSDIENLKATPAPGQITLSWTNPADENLYYVQIEYTIGATGKSYRKQVSQYANELVIDISYPSDQRPGRRKYSNLLPLVVELTSGNATLSGSRFRRRSQCY